MSAVAAAGLDESRWRDIEARIRPFVARRVGSAADIDDVMQEVFVRLNRGLATLRDEERFAPFLVTVARNAVTDHHRRSSRRAEVTLETTPDSVADDEHDDTGLRAELGACVAGFVAALPEEQRQAITLVELEGVSQKDAAVMLGISHSGVKSRVQRARAALRQMFGRACAIQLDGRSRVLECVPKACSGCGPSAPD